MGGMLSCSFIAINRSTKQVGIRLVHHFIRQVAESLWRKRFKELFVFRFIPDLDLVEGRREYDIPFQACIFCEVFRNENSSGGIQVDLGGTIHKIAAELPYLRIEIIQFAHVNKNGFPYLLWI